MHVEPQRISRRSFMVLGGLAVAGVSGAAPVRGTTGAAAFAQPAVLRSAGGRLQARLVARSGTWLGGRYAAQAFGYNQSSPGPTLLVSPGDELTIRLVNRLAHPTNLHTHGLRVSPAGQGDNPFVHVEPGGSFDYRIRIPRDHPPGTHWYHPHHHGHVADQVAGGLLGALLVVPRTGLDPPVDRVLLLHEVDLDVEGRPRPADGMDRHMGRRAEKVLVNGQLAPRISGQVGVPQRWRVINGCPSRTVTLRLAGHRLLQAAVDGNALPTLRDTVEAIPAGGRADVWVEPTEAGRFTLSQVQLRAVDRDLTSVLGLSEPETVEDLLTLATFHVKASSGKRHKARPLLDEVERHPAWKARVDRRRRIAFGDADNKFTMDGKLFDADRVDQDVPFGGVEEWTVANEGHMFHPFHLHGWPFVVMGDGESAAPFGVPQDVVNIAPGGEVRLRIAFHGHRGRSVYHCHILDHEDVGMMGVLEVR